MEYLFKSWTYWNLGMSYSYFYKYVISKLPDRIVENMAGYFYRLYTMLVSQDPIRLPVEVEGLKFINPVGMPAGWIDKPTKIDVVRKLGAGVIIIKTITLNPKWGNPYPRIVRGQHGIINSLGLPNLGLKWWLENYHPVDYPSIISIKGGSLKEWTILIDNLESKTDIFELNFSCPNVSEGIMDLSQSRDLIRDIISITKKRIFLKLSPEYSPQQNLELINSVRSDICGISTINTRPIYNPSLGNPKNVGGISGAPLFPDLISHLSAYRQEYPNHSDLPIFASGGISSPQKAWQIFHQYQSFPLTLTSFLMRGPNVYDLYSKYIQYQLQGLDMVAKDILW
jgi:dihydroorotate dehydrogenase (NAD+) catalytic subunit